MNSSKTPSFATTRLIARLIVFAIPALFVFTPAVRAAGDGLAGGVERSIAAPPR